MHQTLIYFHTYVRWLALGSLLYAIYRAYRGYVSKILFSKTDNAVRHWTATIAHIQLMIGMVLYFKSPIIQYFWMNSKEGTSSIDFSFFAIIHVFLMLVAIVLITTGSAKAKRKQTDLEKFRTMLIWFSIALLIIFLAIP